MNAVRYFSKPGNTKTIAEAIAEGAGVPTVSITDEPELKTYVDNLCLGGAPYAHMLHIKGRADAAREFGRENVR